MLRIAFQYAKTVRERNLMVMACEVGFHDQLLRPWILVPRKQRFEVGSGKLRVPQNVVDMFCL